jgi:hypothetical protein
MKTIVAAALLAMCVVLFNCSSPNTPTITNNREFVVSGNIYECGVMDNMGMNNGIGYYYTILKNDSSFYLYYGDTVQCNSIKKRIILDSNGQFNVTIDTNICILVRNYYKLRLIKFENGLDSIYLHDTIGPLLTFSTDPCYL